MARNKPAKKAKQKSAARKAARKPSKKTSRKAPKKAAKAAKRAKKSAQKRAAKPLRRPTSAKASAGKPKSLKKPVARKAAKPAKSIRSAKPAPKAKPATKVTPAPRAKPVGRLVAAVKSLATAAVAAALAPKKKPNLDRPRRTVADVHGIPSSLDMDRTASSAKSGRADMQGKLSKNNSGGAAITAGDVDADWQSAEAVGDEAPGGDNPTPDQDVVDDIGRALGVEYADDEELQGGAEIADRDTHRWELDPSSKDDFEDEE